MKTSQALSAALVVLCIAALITACGSDDDGNSNTTSDTSSGSDATSDTSGGGDTSGTLSETAYYDGPESALLGATGNQARCSTCHSNDATLIGFSGKTFKDIAYHTSFKGGDAPTLLDAGNACITGWMGGVALTAADAQWTALEAYLKSISAESATDPNTIAPEVLADEAAYEAAYAGGDAGAGAATFGTYCGKCHAAALVVGDVMAYSPSTLATFSVGRIAQKARTSGPPPSGTADASDSTPGPMPFFEMEELPADDLKNIIAFIKTQ